MIDQTPAPVNVLKAKIKDNLKGREGLEDSLSLNVKEFLISVKGTDEELYKAIVNSEYFARYFDENMEERKGKGKGKGMCNNSDALNLPDVVVEGARIMPAAEEVLEEISPETIESTIVSDEEQEVIDVELIFANLLSN